MRMLNDMTMRCPHHCVLIDVLSVPEFSPLLCSVSVHGACSRTPTSPSSTPGPMALRAPSTSASCRHPPHSISLRSDSHAPQTLSSFPASVPLAPAWYPAAPQASLWGAQSLLGSADNEGSIQVDATGKKNFVPLRRASTGRWTQRRRTFSICRCTRPVSCTRCGAM